MSPVRNSPECHSYRMALSLFYSLLVTQLRQRFLCPADERTGTPLDLHILCKLRGGETTPNDLATALGVHRSSALRSIGRLKKLGHVTYAFQRFSRRIKVAALSPDGSKAIDAVLDSDRRKVVKLAGARSKREMDFVCTQLGRLAAGIEADSADEIRTPFMKEIVSFIRGAGMLGTKFLGEGLSFQQLGILFYLRRNKSGLSSREIGTLLESSESALSRALTNLRKHGWISQSKDPADTRRLVNTLTEQGRRSFEALEAKLVHAFQTALKDLPLPRIVELVDTMEQLSGFRYYMPSELISQKLKITQLPSDRFREVVRDLGTSVAKQAREQNMGEMLYLQLALNDAPQALAAFSCVRLEWQLKKLYARPDLALDVKRYFLATAAQIIPENFPATAVSIGEL